MVFQCSKQASSVNLSFLAADYLLHHQQKCLQTIEKHPKSWNQVVRNTQKRSRGDSQPASPRASKWKHECSPGHAFSTWADMRQPAFSPISPMRVMPQCHSVFTGPEEPIKTLSKQDHTRKIALIFWSWPYFNGKKTWFPSSMDVFELFQWIIWLPWLSWLQITIIIH